MRGACVEARFRLVGCAPRSQEILIPPSLSTRVSALATSAVVEAAERRWLSDRWVRVGIRRLLEERIRSLGPADDSADFAARMRANPVAIEEGAANEQHYEVPSAFYDLVLGPRRKYSACWFEPGDTLGDAEERMLLQTAQHARIADGQRILDLGCGWGSFALWAAQRYPHSQILAISNSTTQRETIETAARELGIANLEVRTENAATLDLPADSFDRVVSIEMFEHLRNWPELFERISSWLKPGGAFLMHTFCHRSHAYFYEDEGAGDWMARHFFTGGIMPSFDLAKQIDDHLRVERSWEIDGTHYARTLEAWLERLDLRTDQVRSVLADTYGADQARRRAQRWRLFLMACAELFAARGGKEWFVVHHRLVPVSRGLEAEDDADRS